METIDVSVIIPVYNGEQYLAEAIESVLNQFYRPRQVIVVDDGSTDGSANVARRFSEHIQCYSQPNRGAAAARNLGIKNSKGSFLAFLDADDLWTPDKLKLQWQALQGSAPMDMVLGKVKQFISPDVEDECRQRLRKELETMPAYIMGALLIRRETFLRVGLLNENLQIGEFIDWFQRAKDIGLRHHVLDHMIVKRRIHKTNQGITRRDRNKDYISVLKAALDRKRQLKTKCDT
jgi:glycosyltransferase involved in cell wall biosynthesis